MLNAIIEAVLQPLTQTSTWYGIMLALAFTKHVRRFVEGILEITIGKIKDGK